MRASATPPGPETPTPSSSGRSLAADVAVILVAFLLAGLCAGALWPQLVDPVPVTRVELGLTTSETALAERFDKDGWYSLLAAGCGLVLGVVLTAWRRTDEVVTLLSVVAGAFLAAWVSAEVGSMLGPEDPERLLATAEVGASAPERVRLSSQAPYFMWPVSALIGAILVLWGPLTEGVVGGRDRRGADAHPTR